MGSIEFLEVPKRLTGSCMAAIEAAARRPLGLQRRLDLRNWRCSSGPSGMEKVKIIVGDEYAFREFRGTKSPFQRIKVLQHLRHNKWKAQWIDPNPGLIDYVESAQIIVPWKERKAFLRDEENAASLIERNKADGFQYLQEVKWRKHPTRQFFCKSGGRKVWIIRAHHPHGNQVGRLEGNAHRTARAHHPIGS